MCAVLQASGQLDPGVSGQIMSMSGRIRPNPETGQRDPDTGCENAGKPLSCDKTEPGSLLTNIRVSARYPQGRHERREGNARDEILVAEESVAAAVFHAHRILEAM